MNRITATQDKEKCRRAFDGHSWTTVEPGEVVIQIIGKDLDVRMLTALGLVPEPEESK